MVATVRLRPTIAPNLPTAPVEYDSRAQDILNNVLRLYFNTLDNFNNSLLGVTGTTVLRAPYGSFYDTTTSQTATAATVTKLTLGTTSVASGVSLASSNITVTTAGVYNIQISIQFANAAVADDDVTIWINQNGTPVANSASLISVPGKHGSISGHTVFAVNWVLEAQAATTFNFYWTTDAGSAAGASIITYPASAVAPIHPASPAVITTVTFVSALLT